MNSTHRIYLVQTYCMLNYVILSKTPIFKMAAAAILIYEKATMETFWDSLDFNARHTQVHLHKFSAFYNSIKKSNTLVLYAPISGLQGQGYFIIVYVALVTDLKLKTQIFHPICYNNIMTKSLMKYDEVGVIFKSTRQLSFYCRF